MELQSKGMPRQAENNKVTEEINMVIRRAKKQDIQSINNLLMQTAMVHHNGRPDIFKPSGKKYSDEEIMELIADDSRPIFVAVDEADQVLGYAFCVFKQFFGREIMTEIIRLYLDDLCVDEDKRGMGIGTALFDYVVAYAKENGCYNVELNVWSFNEGAIRFYEKCGLAPQKTIMERIL
jgi:ribosomal protein S18 acetylase RimI-like enzyme